MAGLMKTCDSMEPLHQEVVKAMSDAARDVLREHGFRLLNNDCAAIFDEACAVYLNEHLIRDGNAFAIVPGRSRPLSVSEMRA